MKDISSYEIDISDIASVSHHERDTTLEMTQKLLVSLESHAEEKRELKKNIVNLEIDLYKDVLTQCYSRKWFTQKYLNNNFFRNNGFLIMVDLDSFKAINDTYGHNIGDDALRFISNQLTYLGAEIDDERIVVRLGGDEFCLLIHENHTLEEIEKKIFELRQEILKKHFVTKDEFVIKVGFSYGVTQFNRNDKYEKIMKQADTKMYLNKKNKK